MIFDYEELYLKRLKSEYNSKRGIIILSMKITRE